MSFAGRSLAVTEFPSLTRDQRSFESFIFLRDASEQILPTWERGPDRVRPEVRLVPETEDLTAWLVGLLDPFGEEWRDGLTELVSSFCDILASRLVLRGEAYLEIIPGEKKSDRPVGLVVLPGWIVYRVLGAYLQIVPKPDRPALNRRWTRIPSGRMHRIKLPSRLGSPRAHRRLVRRLDQIPNQPPDWAMEGWSVRAKPTHFDYDRFSRAQRLEVERLLARWGSMTYGHTEGKTEYFQISRMLLNFRARAELRGAALDALNHLIAHTGSDARLECRGLPEPSDIDAGLVKLWTGELSLSEGLTIAGL
ncbi:MAG TPA: hypothetical protein VFX45_02535 [Solirubrobacterales bacterium]|nr:hypothetical protein [Solirubrobacterales bacterium]